MAGMVKTCSPPTDVPLIALFTVNFYHLYHDIIEYNQHVCEAISGYFVALSQNCKASTLKYIAMQMRKLYLE